MTGNLGPNLDSQDCYSANALMQLGGRDLGGGDETQANVSIAELTAGQLSQAGNGLPVQWPMNLFEA